MGDVIWATFPQFRRPQEVALEQMAVSIFDHLHAATPAPALSNGLTGKINDYWLDSAPSEMPPEAS